jgi:hypothetical protein
LDGKGGGFKGSRAGKETRGVWNMYVRESKYPGSVGLACFGDIGVL